MRVIFKGIVEAKERLLEEMGEEAATRLHQWALNRPSELSDSRRVYVVARRLSEGTKS